MHVEQLRALQKAEPFQPFTIRMADGRTFHVPYREFMWVMPNNRTAQVYQEDESHSYLDIMLITELEVAKTQQPEQDGASG